MVAIIIATVLNGTSFGLKRVGLLDPQMYRLYKENINKFESVSFIHEQA
jgi:hypothetical protein